MNPVSLRIINETRVPPNKYLKSLTNQFFTIKEEETPPIRPYLRHSSLRRLVLRDKRPLVHRRDIVVRWGRRNGHRAPPRVDHRKALGDTRILAGDFFVGRSFNLCDGNPSGVCKKRRRDVKGDLGRGWRRGAGETNLCRLSSCEGVGKRSDQSCG